MWVREGKTRVKVRERELSKIVSGDEYSGSDVERMGVIN